MKNKILFLITVHALLACLSLNAQVTTITVASPNGGEILNIGKEYDISWTSNSIGDVGVKIEYSIDNGVSWKPITQHTHAQNQTFPWQVKKGISNQCKIKISSLQNPNIFDVSNANFSIIASTEGIPTFSENVRDGIVNQSLWNYTNSGNSCENSSVNDINRYHEAADENGDTSFHAKIVSSWTCTSRSLEATLLTSSVGGQGNFYNSNSKVVIDFYSDVTDGCFQCDFVNDSDSRYYITDGINNIEFYRPTANQEGIEEGCQCATVFGTISNDRRHIFTFLFDATLKKVRIFKGNNEIPNSPFDLSMLNNRWSLKFWGKSHSFQTAYSARVDFRVYDYAVYPNTSSALFDEQFNNLNNWTLYGAPLPLHVQSIFGKAGIFDNNGDPNYNSGAISNQTFNLSSGFTLESEVYLDFSNLNGCWSSAAIGISDPEYKTWGGYDPYIYFNLFANGDACWGSPTGTHRRTMISGGYRFGPNPSDWVPLGDLTAAPTYGDQYANKWSIMKIVVDNNRMPKFYIDNNLIFTGTVPIFTGVLDTPRPIWLGDRSSGSAGKAYHNWVTLNATQNNNPFQDENVVLNGALSGLKIVEGIKIGTMNIAINQQAMLTANYANCQKIGDYIVYSKDARSLDPLDWNAENGTAFTGDKLPIGLSIKFAWKSDGIVYMGESGSDTEVLSTLVDGVHWTALGLYFTPTFFEGFALRSELANLRTAGFAVGIPHLDSLNTDNFHNKLTKKVYNRFNKKIFRVGSAVTLSGWPATILSEDWTWWTTLSGIGTGTGKRNFNLNYQNAGLFYVHATASNDNSNSSYIKINGTTVAQMAKWETNFYRRSAFLPNSVEISATNSWSGSVPVFRLAVLADSVWATGVTQTPTGGLSNNRPPVITSILPWSPSTDLKDIDIPSIFSLEQNYPNPFNPVTQIRYTLKTEALVIVKIFNQLGEEVATLVNEAKLPGSYETTFNSKNLASGVYFYRMQAGDFVETKKLILLK